MYMTAMPVGYSAATSRFRWEENIEIAAKQVRRSRDRAADNDNHYNAFRLHHICNCRLHTAFYYNSYSPIIKL